MTIQRAVPLDPPAHYLEGANFQIVVPEESTNLITNPSFETNTTSWVNNSAVSMARVTTQSFFGAASLRTQTNTTGTGAYYDAGSAIATGTTYTFSAYMRGLGTVSFFAFGATSGFIVSKTIKLTNDWRRYTITFTFTGADASRAFGVNQSGSGTADIYIDGVQLEAKPYPTTYIDGDQEDCIWLGAAHGSSSFRPVTTRKGGRPMSLSDYKFKIVAVVGAGAAALSTIATPYANIGGAYYQRSIPQARTLQIAGQFECAGQIDLMRNRAALIDAVNPNRTANPQPARLLYTPLGCASDEPAKQVVIDGVYAGGLEGNQTNEAGIERAIMSFNVYFPFMAVGSGVGDRGVALTANQVLSSPNGLVSRNRITGAWSTLSGGANTITRIVMGTDGLPIFIGSYTSIGGVSANYIAKWDGSTFVPYSTGPGGVGGVLTGAVGPDGSVYYGYSTSLTNYRIRKWNGSSWSTLADFTHGSDARLYAIAVGPDGSIYAAGQFTNAGGSAITNLAKYNGSSWSALGTAPNGIVSALALDKAGNLYAGGQFTSIGGTSASRIAMYNGSAWVALGSGMTISAGTCMVTTLYVASDGRLYAYGDFDTAGGVSAAGIAVWNGASWVALGAGLNPTVTGYEGAIYEDEGPGVVVAGPFTVVDDPNKMFLTRWTGSVWVPGPVHFLTGSGNYLTSSAYTGQLQFLGGAFNYATLSNSMIVPGVATVTVNTQTNNVRFVFTGPGTLVSVRNYASGDEIYFDLTLNAGEVATLTLGQKVSFISNFRGNIASTIVGVSNLAKFRLLPGANNVAVFMTGTSGATAASLVYKEMYQSLDAIVQ